MASSGGDDQDLTSLLGDAAQADRIPEDLRPILLERWSKLRQQLDASRPSVANVGESAEKSGGIDPSNNFQHFQMSEFQLISIFQLLESVN